MAWAGEEELAIITFRDVEVLIRACIYPNDPKPERERKAVKQRPTTLQKARDELTKLRGRRIIELAHYGATRGPIR